MQATLHFGDFAGIAFVFGEMPDILLLSFQSNSSTLMFLVYLGNKSILDCLDGVVRPLVILSNQSFLER